MPFVLLRSQLVGDLFTFDSMQDVQSAKSSAGLVWLHFAEVGNSLIVGRVN